MATIVRLGLRHSSSVGDSSEIASDDIDLDRLSPRARALAEAIAQRPERNRGAIGAVNGAGTRVSWSGWSLYPVDSPMNPHDYLEQQAARFPGDWTIAGSREQPIPSLTGQDREWIAKQCADAWGVKPNTWRAYVARGQAPQPIRRVGSTPVWDPAQVTGWPRPGQGARTDRTKEQNMATASTTTARLVAGFGDHPDLWEAGKNPEPGQVMVFVEMHTRSEGADEPTIAPVASAVIAAADVHDAHDAAEAALAKLGYHVTGGWEAVWYGYAANAAANTIL
jgi:hypothetical protein